MLALAWWTAAGPVPCAAQPANTQCMYSLQAVHFHFATVPVQGDYKDDLSLEEVSTRASPSAL